VGRTILRGERSKHGRFRLVAASQQARWRALSDLRQQAVESSGAALINFVGLHRF
jgi:hypothetical protein